MRDGSPQLAAERRTVVGKKVRFLRRRGITPANIFGHNLESIAVQVETRELEHMLTHVPRNSLVSLNVAGSEPATVLVKVVSRKPTTGELYHIDFYHVSMTEKLRANVPLVLTGTAPAAETRDATILQSLDTLPVECLPQNLPNQIEVDISGLVAIDDSIFVRDLHLPAGVTTVVNEDDLVVKALAPTVEEVAAPEAEAAAGPEVIREKKEEGEAAPAAAAAKEKAPPKEKEQKK